MPAVVVLRKITTGTESERIVAALEEKVGRKSERDEDLCTFAFIEQPGGWEENAAGVERELDRISETWPIHVQIVDPR